MVNIEQITSTLAKLPDQALQRYAQMHKDDPYIMSLAVSESKRRKEMRAAGQGQMQQQPKVVDQAVAAMAPQPMPSMPEEQGIGALPAAAQMNFADGGITGYAGGGEIESYQDRGLVRPYETPYDRMNRQNREDAAAAQAEREAQAAAIGVTPYGEQMSRMGSAFAGIPGKILSGAGELVSNLVSAPGTRGNTMLSDLVGSQAPGVAVAAPAQYDPAQATRRSAYEQASSGEDRGAAGRTGADQSATYRAGPSAARAPAAPTQSVEDRFLASQKKMTDQPNPHALQESAVQTEAEKLAKAKLSSVEARQAMFKDAFKGREGRLEERAKELEKSKDTNTGLAFLEAGLAIMSTPGGLATAIGKGAREGTAKYAAGIDKLRSAKDKLDEAKDRMEELKLNRDEMSAKEKAEAELGIQQTVLSGKKDALSSAKTLFGERSALSQKIVETTIGMEEKAKDRATQVQTAGAAAAIGRQSEVQFINDWLAKPENKGKSFSDAYAAFKAAGTPSAATRGVMTRDQASDNVAKALEPGIDRKRTIEDATAALKVAGVPNPTLAQIKEHLIQEQMRGAGLPSLTAPSGAAAPSSGKVPPPPSGFKLNG